MRTSVAVRLLVVCLMLASAVGLLVQYERAEDAHTEYPTIAELESDYDGHVGSSHYFWGEVEATTANGFVTSYYEMRFEVVDSDADVRVGDTVQVYGVVRPERTIAAERVVRSDPGGRTYMFAVSGVAALLTAGVFARRWEFDRRTWSLRGRQSEGEDRA